MQNRSVLQDLLHQFNLKHSNIQVKSFYVEQADQQTLKILASVAC